MSFVSICVIIRLCTASRWLLRCYSHRDPASPCQGLLRNNERLAVRYLLHHIPLKWYSELLIGSFPQSSSCGLQKSWGVSQWDSSELSQHQQVSASLLMADDLLPFSQCSLSLCLSSCGRSEFLHQLILGRNIHPLPVRKHRFLHHGFLRNVQLMTRRQTGDVESRSAAGWKWELGVSRSCECVSQH